MEISLSAKESAAVKTAVRVALKGCRDQARRLQSKRGGVLSVGASLVRTLISITERIETLEGALVKVS